jgi:hypothetical protein
MREMTHSAGRFFLVDAVDGIFGTPIFSPHGQTAATNAPVRTYGKILKAMWRRSARLSLILVALLMRAATPSADTARKALWLYAGSWQVTRSNSSNSSKPERLVNQCAAIGLYFACQQTVNDKAGGLLIIMPAGSPGHYFTQTVMPDGRATGRDDLVISGDRWTFTSRRLDNGRASYYRTVNTFVGRTRIQFEQAESTNGNDWTVKVTGDERRVGDAPVSATH